MNWIDFFIGFTLLNFMPHFVLGIWKVRMLSAFGFSPRANVGYGLLNLAVSLGLFLYQYGWEGFAEQAWYAGALFIGGSYLLVGRMCYRYFHVKYHESSGQTAQSDPAMPIS
ncbi:hypothetical protein [Pontibacter sp. G13]|uniref:hypothetical protein n=1 Tax=Pontibacter sp. G13 TaxID=3074898 RepID=UPI0028897D82|nr:hypothetical protein [Pontibacter sp. G13]WNJ18434.1 hypothetical protein RJD25_26565 [Pontibacter sp. G13]